MTLSVPLSYKRAAWRRAFTIVETLVAIVIMAVLAAIVMPSAIEGAARAKVSVRAGHLNELQEAANRCLSDTGLYPPDLAGLTTSTAPATGLNPRTGAAVAIAAANWHGPYLEQIPKDPITSAAYGYKKLPPQVGVVVAPGVGLGTEIVE